MSTSTADGITLTLPGGLLDGDRRHQGAEVRPLTGREEELLVGMGCHPSAAERVTAVLGRCLTRLGPADLGPSTVRRLTVGDREALLLGLRWATFGDRIDCVLTCPAEGCGGRIDLTLRPSELLVDPYDAFPAWYEESFGDVGVRFRLPTGDDQEQVAGLARADAAGAARRLLARCVDGAVDLSDEELADAIGCRMADLDPQAELGLQLSCPWCGVTVDTVLDMAAFLFAEVAGTASRLYQEVHLLAWTYHWGEAEILGLPAPRRRRYLDLIADSTDHATSRRSA